MILGRDLKMRHYELDQFLLGIRIMTREMSYAAPSLEVCFRRAGDATEGTMAQIFSLAADGIAAEKDEGAFGKALMMMREDLFLTDGDLEWMGRFGVGLGVADLENTLKSLGYMEERAKEALRTAEQNENRWGRVFLRGGWLLGFAVALVFI